MYENVKEALFGFNDKETGIKLSAFYKKHTGREVDFNAIKHDKDGFKLLLFSIPLGRISTLDINEANGYPAKKFSGPVQEFMDWYEKEYLVFKDYEIIKHIPHASLEFPPSYQEEGGVSKSLVFGKNYKINNFKMTDLFVDQLFQWVPGVEVKAKYTRLYCDVEKYRDDRLEPMSKYGQGYVYTISFDGEKMRRHFQWNGVDPDGDIDEYYDGHHASLTAEVRKILEKKKKVLILDLHSYSDEQAIHIEKKPPFPDICIGLNEGFKNKKLLDAILRRIEDNGFSYQINYPYSGSIMPNRLKKSELKNVESIMLEVNKRLYL